MVTLRSGTDYVRRLRPDGELTEWPGVSNLDMGEIKVLKALSRELERPCDLFAYPFGRRWDYDERTLAAAREAGVEYAVNTHAGTIDGRSDPLQLARGLLEPHEVDEADLVARLLADGGDAAGRRRNR